MNHRLPTAERQTEIIGAALRLACSRSPAHITTTDIAMAIGVTQGAVFKHFPNKDSIWLAAMRWVRGTLLSQLALAARTAESPLSGLCAVFRAHVDFVIEHPGVPRVIFHELQQPDDSAVKLEVRELLHGYRQLLLELLGSARASQQIDPELDVQAAATSFIGLIQGLVMQSMLTGKPEAMRGQADGVLALYLQGLGGVR